MDAQQFQQTSSLPKHGRRRTLRLGLTTLAITVVMVVGLFVVNGVWFAAGETPLVGVASLADTSQRAFRPDLPSDVLGESNTITVLSYNIAKGMLNDGSWRFDASNVDHRLATIAELIRRENPDLVFLSEVVYECQPCSRNQVAYLARETGLRHWAFGENYNFGLPFMRIVGGNAILSRWPLEPVANTSLAGRKPFYVTRNNRRALWCRAQLGGEPLLLASIHNDSFKLKNNLAQMRQIVEFADGRPAIIAGDFNSRPDEPPILYLRESGHFVGKIDGPMTFPAQRPEQTIDFIFAPADWKLVNHRVPPFDASDHLPVVSTFLRPPN